jgi:hypothetical protein
MSGRAYEPRFLFTWPEPQDRGDGRQAAGRRARHHSEKRGVEKKRRGGRRRDALGHAQADDRVPDRSASPPRCTRRRGSGTTASSTCATRAPCWRSRSRRRTRAGRRAPPASASSATDRRGARTAETHEVPRRQPWRDRPAHHAHRRARWACRPWPCSPTPTPTRRTCALADEAVRIGPAPAKRVVPALRQDPRGREEDRRRRRSPGLRLPLRERRLRAGLRGRRARLRRSHAGGHPRHGPQA